MIIGLGYEARSGKDTVATFLHHRCGFSRVAFADALKEACAAVFGFSKVQLYGDEKERMDGFWNMTPREVLQKVGTECFRQNFSPDIWVRALRKRISNRLKKNLDIVVTDVRFPNEAAAIKDWGGVLVRVDRPGSIGASGGIAGHASETSLLTWSHWDDVIVNDGSLADLEMMTIILASRLGVYSKEAEEAQLKQLPLPL